MDIKSKINLRYIGITIFVVALIGAGFWYWQKKSPVQVIQKSVDQKTTDVSLGNQILLKTQKLLTDKFPETNPLKKIIKNPF